ncbi:hypothetical protein [Arhodomonas sp. SL1]|uniref:hypothetical protein n=1 Tax=Arhodomonas sp. SL1 TaxID=3425691 RepID=UPI003F882FE1
MIPRLAVWVLAGLLFALVPMSVAAATLRVTPGDYREHLSRLRPGDEMLLAPGRYTRGLPLHGIRGRPGAPITIRGERCRGEVVLVGEDGRNTVSLRNAAYIRITDLAIDGRRRNADGIKAEGDARWVHDITLERLALRNHDGHQQLVAISTKAPAWNWVIRDVVIDGAGTGMYLGDSDGGAWFVGGLIENIRVRNTIGYALQIKHQRPREAVPGMPAGPRQTVIRDSVFDKSHGGAHGRRARPSVLLGHQPLRGPGRRDRYLVYRNLFYENPTEALLQAEGRIAVYANAFVNTAGAGRGIVIMDHRAPPRWVDINHNTVVARDIGIAVWDAAPGARRRVAANAVFAARPVTGDLQALWNHVAGFPQARTRLAAPFLPLSVLDLRPRAGALVDPRIPRGGLLGFPNAETDYTGRPWTRGIAGAFSTPSRAP